MKSKELLCIVQLLVSGDEKLSKTLLKGCSDDVITFIGETALNLLNQVIPLSTHFKSKLQDHAWFIRSIGSKRVKVNARRKLCVKHSEIVGLLMRATSGDLEQRLLKQ